MWRFCFARIRLHPLSGKILYHDSVPVVVCRFAFIIQDFVICRYQVTKHFCSRWSFASASSARGFRYFCSQADVAISVFGLSFVKDSCPSFPVASSSLRCNTESEVELAAAVLPDATDASGPNDSGDGEVEDELLSELTDNPGTTWGNKIVGLADNTFPIFGQSWLLTADPLVGVSVVFAKLTWRRDSWRFFELLHGYELNTWFFFAHHVHRRSWIDYEFSFSGLFEVKGVDLPLTSLGT